MKAYAPRPGAYAPGVAPRRAEPQWRYMRNVSGKVAPRGGLGMTVGWDADAKVEKFCPALPGFLGVCITAAEIAPGEIGKCWVSGKHLAYTPGARGVYAGDRFTGDGRFGPLGYWYGVNHGVFLVSSVFYTGETSGDGYPRSDWLIAEILSDNGCDCTYVGGSAGAGFKPMATTVIVFGLEFKAANWTPEWVNIGLAG